MSHPRSTVNTYGKRRAPYNRSQVQLDSDSPTGEQEWRPHHLQEFRLGGPKNRSALDASPSRNANGPPPPLLQPTKLNGTTWFKFFSTEANEEQLYNPVTGEAIPIQESVVEQQLQVGGLILDDARELAEAPGPRIGTSGSISAETTRNTSTPSRLTGKKPPSLFDLRENFTTDQFPSPSPSSLLDHCEVEFSRHSNHELSAPRQFSRPSSTRELPAPRQFSRPSSNHEPLTPHRILRHSPSHELPTPRQFPGPSSNPAYGGVRNPRAADTPIAQDSLALIDDKDRPVTVRDMERFTRAIQDTMQEVGRQFSAALLEIHQRGSESESESE